MNTANKLTIFRFLLVFPAVFFVLCSFLPHRWFFAFLVFMLASYTDHLDGKIARKYNYVTDFGKIMDPLADKILVISMFICFVGLNLLPILPVILIVIREFTITSFRFLLLKNEGNVVSANVWGKLKTIVQMFSIMTVMMFQMYIEIFGNNIIFGFFSYILIWISTALSLISGGVYILKNIKFLKMD